MTISHRKPDFAAFTLIELLTAMTVLALILVLMSQVVGGLLQSTRTQTQQMNGIAAARRALDVMATDFQNAVVGENAAILVPDAGGTNLFAFLTTRQGPAGSNPRFLAVRYATNSQNQLVRAYDAVGFTATDLIAAAPAASSPVEPLVRGLLAIQAAAVADGTNYYWLTNAPTANWATNSYNGSTLPAGFKALLTTGPSFSSALTNRTRAIEVWVAAVDEQEFERLRASSTLSLVQSLLNGSPTGARGWRSAIDAAALPAQTKSAIRILNKTIPVR